MAQHLRQGDAHGTDRLAAAAEAGGVGQGRGVLDADEGRREDRADRPRIDPAVSVAADRVIDRAVVHAGAAADAAQGVLELAAQHVRAPVVEQDDVIRLRPVRVAGPVRAGREGGVGRALLAGRRAGQHPQDHVHVLQGGHDLFQAGDDDVDPGQTLGQVAVALVGDDDRAAGLGHQEVGAGDADVGVDILLAQDFARLFHEIRRLGQRAFGRQMAVVRAERRFDLAAGQVNRRGDNVARRFAAQLDDVFAQVRLHRHHALGLQEGVEADFLGDHRLAFGHRLGAGGAADLEDGPAGVLGRRAPMNLTAGCQDLGLIALQIEIEVGQGMVLDVPGRVAQGLELGQPVGRLAPLADEARLDVAPGARHQGIGERLAGIFLKTGRGPVHGGHPPSPIAGPSPMAGPWAESARTSAT